MTKKVKILVALFVLTMVAVQNGQAQLEKIRNYVFAADSLVGFDEAAANAGAIANNSFGDEYKVFMYHAKRTFVKQKYQLPTPSVQPVTLFNNPLVAGKSSAVGGACNNEDFELSAGIITPPGVVQGWSCQSGNNSGLGCNPVPTPGNANYTVYNSPIIDPVSGQIVQSYFDAASNVQPAGNSFIRLNDASAGSKVARLVKQFIVTPTNALFQYAYWPTIEDGSHNCCSQSGFDIKLTVTNTVTNQSTVLSCPQISVAVPSPACQFTLPANAPAFTSTVVNFRTFLYHTWAASAIDLTAYLGQQIEITITVKDCDQGGHASYCYFDAKCAPMTIQGNNQAFPAGTASINLPTCGLLGATICAPDGMGPYSWAGQGVVAPYTSPLMSNQCYSTGINADFTLTMNPQGSCQPITRVITVTITPAPYMIATAIQPSCGQNTAMVTFTAAGSASVNPAISFSPSPSFTSMSTQNVGSAVFPAGVGVVTVQGLDPLGCKATSTVNILPSPPNVTVAIMNNTSPSITCISPSIELAAISGYTYGTLNYYWSSNSFTNTNPTITVTSPATLITLLATDPVTGCQGQFTTSIGINIQIPQANVSPTIQNVTCASTVVTTFTATAINPTVNVTHCWTDPLSPQAPVCGGGNLSIFPGLNPGTYTYQITNNVNGCVAQQTLLVVSSNSTYPVFTQTTSPGNYTIGCGSTSLTTLKITFADTYPNTGGSLDFALISPTTIGAPAFSSTMDFNINTPGNYTLVIRDAFTGCSSRVVVPIVQYTAQPNLSVTYPTTTLTCYTPSVILQGISTETVPLNYLWTFQNGSLPNVVNNATIDVHTTTNVAVTGSVVNTFSLQLMNMDNKCFSNTVVPVYQNIRPPKAKINGAGGIDCANNLSQTLVNGSTLDHAPGFVPLKGTAAVHWEGPTPQEPADTVASYKALTVGTYTMWVVDRNNGCVSFTTATVADNRIYPVLLTSSVVALDCGATGVNLAVNAVGLKPADVTAKWTAPVPTPNIKNPTTLTLTTDGVGEYALSVITNSNGCGSVIIVNVVPGVLTGGITADQESGYAPLTVNFTNSSASTSTATGASSVTTVWSFGNGTARTTTTNASTSAVYSQPGTYTVVAFVSKGGCSDTVYKVITVDIPSKLVVPNVFTPNGDNNNDLFFVKAANLSEITVIIYDRWGNKVYELTTDKGNIAWDGKNMTGKEAQEGTYFYIITAKGKDGQSYDQKGNVSLFR